MWFPPCCAIWKQDQSVQHSFQTGCTVTHTVTAHSLHSSWRIKYILFFHQEVFNSDITRRDFEKDVLTSFDLSCDLLVFKIKLPCSLFVFFWSLLPVKIVELRLWLSRSSAIRSLIWQQVRQIWVFRKIKFTLECALNKRRRRYVRDGYREVSLSLCH